MIAAKIIADSIGPAGIRLTTWVLEYPRFIHAELMTHRAFSRNAASSRAIPAKRLRERIMANPAEPVYWGKNQAGMQAGEEIEDVEACKNWWLRGLEQIERLHVEGEARGIHKQILNRIIEPWMHIAVVMTADEQGLAQMFHQRRHPDAQPEFQALANTMWDVYQASTPKTLGPGQWHLPFITDEDRQEAPLEHQLLAISVGRCARVSYLNHEGKRSVEDDIQLHDRLIAQVPGHWSPLEHQAQALEGPARFGNLTGWLQYRKTFTEEFQSDMPVK